MARPVRGRVRGPGNAPCTERVTTVPGSAVSASVVSVSHPRLRAEQPR